jgi:hypothetical protein
MQIQETRPKWGILAALFVVLGALAALPFFLLFQPKSSSPPFEVRNFVGQAEFYAHEKRAWVPLRRGGSLGARDKIRTGPGGEVDLQLPDKIQIRLKENSQAEGPKPKLFEKELASRLHLLRGAIVSSTEKDFAGQFEISTPVLVAAVRGTELRVESNPETRESWVGVLRGTAEVRSIGARKWVTVKALEKTEVKGNAPPMEPVRVSRKEWDRLKEAYELIQKSAALEARQMDLSKEAGNLFQYVFDHGTFYTEKFGYCEREFIKDEATGKVHLEVNYDVFPTGSFAGMYIKTRDLDMSKFKALSFQLRINPEEGFPESFRIELKSGSGIARLFVPREFKPNWQTFQFPLRFNQPTKITEITIVFGNEKAGTHKKGSMALRDLTLEPAIAQSQPA